MLIKREFEIKVNATENGVLKGYLKGANSAILKKIPDSFFLNRQKISISQMGQSSGSNNQLKPL